MATTDLVTKKINHAIAKKLEIAELLNLEGNPTWDEIIAALKKEKTVFRVGYTRANVSPWYPTFGIPSIDQYNITGLRWFGYCVIQASTFARSSTTDSNFRYFTTLELLWDDNYSDGEGTNLNGFNIQDNSFKYHNLEKVVLTAKIYQIGASAFQMCYQLKSVALPKYLQSIGNNAFYYCTALEDIQFKGTMAEWNTITKGTNWNSSVPATVVHCSDGDVSL